ncbi:MAG: hypothetical protein HY897_12920 [Deltaproteobacteria bacterium]|nr:hypothetical protein [Deltaproteobacteria bacterium]
MFRQLTHFLFHVLLILSLLNYRYLGWKEYILVLLVAAAAATSYTRFGDVLRQPGWTGLTVLQTLFLVVLFFLTAFPVAGSPIRGDLAAWSHTPGAWMTAAILALGAFSFLSRFVERPPPAPGAADRGPDQGIFGGFLVAVLLTVIVMGAITIGVEWLFLPGNVRGARMDVSLLLVAVNSLVLVIASRRVFADSDGRRGTGPLGIFVVGDYRPQFLVLLALLAAWGGYSSARVLLAEWRAGEAYGAKDYPRAQEFLESVRRHNTVLKFTALERRTFERQGEIFFSAGKLEEAARAYRAMLAMDPADFLPTIRLAQIEAVRGNYDAAARHVQDAGLQQRTLKAVARLDKLLDCCPDFVEGQFLLGMAYLQKGSDESAAAKFALALGRNPAHVPVLGVFSELCERQGRAGEAAELRERMVLRVDAAAWQGPRGGSLTWYGGAAIEVDLAPGAWRAELAASAAPKNGAWPRIRLRVDGVVAAELTVASGDERTYEVFFRVKDAGRHAISFSHEAYDPPGSAYGGEAGAATVQLGSAVIRWIDR